MSLAEKGGLPLEMFVLCRSSLKKQVSNSYKGKVECSEVFVMLIEVCILWRTWNLMNIGNVGPAWLININVNADGERDCYINSLRADTGSTLGMNKIILKDFCLFKN